MRRRAGLFIVLAIALAAVAFPAAPAMAQSASWTNCSDGSYDTVCALVENRALWFSGQGNLSGMSMERASITRGTGSTAATNPDSFWAMFTGGVRDGYVSYRPTRGVLANEQLRIKIDSEAGDYKPASCVQVQYFTCVRPRLFGAPGKYSSNDLGDNELAVVVIRSHPVIVRIVNQTDQTLNRSTDVRETGMIQDTETTSDAHAASIPPLSGDRPGTGYYHFFRDVSVANDMTVAYTFAPGGTGVLTGAVLNMELSIDADGVASGTCTADKGLAVNLECAVAVLGQPEEGTTIAIVSVAA